MPYNLSTKLTANLNLGVSYNQDHVEEGRDYLSIADSQSKHEFSGKKKPSNDLLSHGVSPEVSSALKGLTAVFEMGTGGTPSL